MNIAQKIEAMAKQAEADKKAKAKKEIKKETKKSKLE